MPRRRRWRARVPSTSKNTGPSATGRPAIRVTFGPYPGLLAAEPEQLLRHLAHLDLLGALGDPVAAMVTVDVLEGHVAAVANAATGLHRPIGGFTRQPVGAVVAHGHEM